MTESKPLYTSDDLASPEDSEPDPFDDQDLDDESFALEDRILDEGDDFGTVVPGKKKRVRNG